MSYGSLSFPIEVEDSDSDDRPVVGRDRRGVRENKRRGRSAEGRHDRRGQRSRAARNNRSRSPDQPNRDAREAKRGQGLDEKDQKANRGQFGRDIPEGGFRFSGKKVHLTYPGHLDIPAYLAFVAGVAPIHYHSVVHEVGEEKAHDHTHVLLIFREKFDTQRVRILDFNGAHPNWKAVITKAHLNNIWTYHHKQGNPVTNMKGPEGKNFYDQVQECETWKQVLQLPQANSIQRAKEIWKQVQTERMQQAWKEEIETKLTPYQHQVLTEAKTGFKRRRLIYVTGPPGCGKTTLGQYMCAVMNGVYTESENANGIALSNVSLETKVIVLDLSYDFNPRDPQLFGRFLEGLANGVATASNYTCQTIMHRAAVVILSNMPLLNFKMLSIAISTRDFVEFVMPAL